MIKKKRLKEIYKKLKILSIIVIINNLLFEYKSIKRNKYA
jgi:hypothetical protein